MRSPEEYANLAEEQAQAAEAEWRGPASASLASLANAYATLALVAIELRNNR